MLSRPKVLDNRLNAQQSTSPKTSRGKRVSSHNSRKHGLNVEIYFEFSDDCAFLKSLLVNEGYSPFVVADIATSLLNYRRVMDAHYETYTKTNEVYESTWNTNLLGLCVSFRGMSEGLSVIAAEIRSMTRLFSRL